MNKLPVANLAQILHMIRDGSSMRCVSRIVDCSSHVVAMRLNDFGADRAAAPAKSAFLLAFSLF